VCAWTVCTKQEEWEKSSEVRKNRACVSSMVIVERAREKMCLYAVLGFRVCACVCWCMYGWRLDEKF